MVSSKYRGHKIIWIDNKWIYEDTRELVSENKERVCAHCGKENTVEGHAAV